MKEKTTGYRYFKQLRRKQRGDAFHFVAANQLLIRGSNTLIESNLVRCGRTIHPPSLTLTSLHNTANVGAPLVLYGSPWLKKCQSINFLNPRSKNTNDSLVGL